MSAVKRPVLRYHGGKWKLAPWLLNFFPPHRIYVEPCGGGASLLMRKVRSVTEIYNDLDAEIVNVFRVLRDRAQAAELARLLALTPYARDEFYAAYEPCDEPIERARRIVVRSQMGQGSLAATRAARSGFNARLNGHQGLATQAGVMKRLPDELEQFTERLAGVIIENRPALNVICQYDRPDALIYCDPPYLPETRSAGSRGYRHEMTAADHEALIARLRAAQAMVIVSGYPSTLYDDGFAGWERQETEHMAHDSRPRTEVAWMNPACSAALRASRAQLEIAA